VFITKKKTKTTPGPPEQKTQYGTTKNAKNRGDGIYRQGGDTLSGGQARDTDNTRSKGDGGTEGLKEASCRLGGKGEEGNSDGRAKRSLSRRKGCLFLWQWKVKTWKKGDSKRVVADGKWVCGRKGRGGGWDGRSVFTWRGIKKQRRGRDRKS